MKKRKEQPIRANVAKILARIDGLNLTDARFAQLAGLAKNFLSLARRGGSSGPRSAAGWAKAEKAVKRLEAQGAGKAHAVAPAPPVQTDSAPGSQTASAAQAELAEAMFSASTADEVFEVTKKVGLLMNAGHIDPNLGRALNDNLSRQHQLLKERRVEEQHGSGNEPTVVEVRYVNGWHMKGKCVYCGGRGEVGENGAPLDPLPPSGSSSSAAVHAG